MTTASRARRLEVLDRTPTYRPVYVVWELTLACDQPCTHCGSRAGDARDGELTTAAALDVVDQLARMGAEEVVLIGGEAYLHEGFLDIVRALAAAGVRPVMTTGGRGVTRALADAMAGAGLQRTSVSIDGLEATHDLMRAGRGSFRAACDALAHLRAAGIEIAANTNLNRLNQADLEPLFEHLQALAVRSWQIQLTTPLGRAADRPDLILQPFDLLDVVPRVAALKERAFAAGMLVMPGNNLGYFGPEEALLRSMDRGGEDHWQGCQAGRYVLGIESDGAVKGCPSLQSAHYVGGTLKEARLDDIWSDSPELAFTRERSRESLWGFCKDCEFGDVCLGGCTFTAHAFFGKPGNQPYCHFRARQLRARGLRERVVRRAEAPGDPFDNGLWDLVTEPFDAADDRPERALDLVKLRRIGARAV